MDLNLDDRIHGQALARPVNALTAPSSSNAIMDHANVALIKAIVDRDSAHGTRQAFD